MPRQTSYSVMFPVLFQTSVKIGDEYNISEDELNALGLSCYIIDCIVDIDKNCGFRDYYVYVDDNTLEVILSLRCQQFCPNVRAYPFDYLIDNLKEINIEYYDEEDLTIEVNFVFENVFQKTGYDKKAPHKKKDCFKLVEPFLKRIAKSEGFSISQYKLSWLQGFCGVIDSMTARMGGGKYKVFVDKQAFNIKITITTPTCHVSDLEKEFHWIAYQCMLGCTVNDPEFIYIDIDDSFQVEFVFEGVWDN